jgi:hypothetical protein
VSGKGRSTEGGYQGEKVLVIEPGGGLGRAEWVGRLGVLELGGRGEWGGQGGGGCMNEEGTAGRGLRKDSVLF